MPGQGLAQIEAPPVPRAHSGTARAAQAAPLCGDFAGGKQIGPRGGQKVHGSCSSAESPRELVCKRKCPGEVGELGTAPPVCSRGAAPRIPPLLGFLGPWVPSLLGPVLVPAPRPNISQGRAISLPGKVRGFGGAGVSQPGRAGPAAPDPRQEPQAPRQDPSTRVTFIFDAEKFLPPQKDGCEGRIGR